MEGRALLEMEYQGHKIILTEMHRFAVEEDHESDFATYEEAERRIDRILAAESKQKKEKLSIPVLRSDGQEFVVTGIHASNYSPLGIKFDAQHRGMMYPASDKVRDLLSRRRALTDQINAIDATLRKYQIHYDYGWARRNSTYDEMLTQLKNAVATALKALEEDAA